MLVQREYDRNRAADYAEKWAFARNPLFFDFVGIGGDCTNFVSQCLYAGCCAMNLTDTFGWYYISPSERAPAWTGVQFLYNFLTSNDGAGPYGEEVKAGELELGDVIQLGRRDGTYYHTLLVTGFERKGYLVSAHSDDAYNRRLSSYSYQRIRYIHILGARLSYRECECYQPLYEGSELIICGDILPESIPEAPEEALPNTAPDNARGSQSDDSPDNAKEGQPDNAPDTEKGDQPDKARGGRIDDGFDYNDSSDQPDGR